MDNQNPLPPSEQTQASTPVTPAGTAYTPPTPPPSSTVPPIPEQIPKKKLPWMVFLAIFLVLGLVGGGVYYYLNIMQQPQPVVMKKTTVTVKKVPTKIPTATPMASESATASDSAGWKTYTSLDNIYTIQYPSDTFIRYICPSEELTLSPRGDEKEETIDMPTCARDGLYTIEVRTWTTPFTPQQSDEYYNITKKDITVSGIPAQRYTTTMIKEPMGPGVAFSDDVYVPYKGKTYQIHVGSKDLMTTFDQMISTFKFIK